MSLKWCAYLFHPTFLLFLLTAIWKKWCNAQSSSSHIGSWDESDTRDWGWGYKVARSLETLWNSHIYSLLPKSHIYVQEIDLMCLNHCWVGCSATWVEPNPKGYALFTFYFLFLYIFLLSRFQNVLSISFSPVLLVLKYLFTKWNKKYCFLIFWALGRKWL